MRDTLTFTIDPKMQRILMMPYHLKKLDNGNYEMEFTLMISYYLEEGTILMMKRINVLPLCMVDRVVPMLPEVLSNFACSLRPQEEYFLSNFEISEKAEVINGLVERLFSQINVLHTKKHNTS
jgi:exoribonuclease R